MKKRSHRTRTHRRRHHRIRRNPAASIRRHYRRMRRRVRRNPAAAVRRHHRRKHYRYKIRHVITRVRTNPPGGAMQQIGGIVAGQIAITLVDGLIVAKLASSISSSAASGAAPTTGISSQLLITSGITAGIGIGGYYLLRKSMPNFALGVGAGAVTSVAMQLLAAAGLSVLSSAQQASLPSASNGYGYSGSGYSYAGYGQATGAYLGGPRRRRMMMRTGAYLGGPGRRMRRMGAYLTPGQSVQSLVGAVTPTAKTFAHNAGNLSGMYSGPRAFSGDAWSR